MFRLVIPSGSSMPQKASRFLGLRAKSTSVATTEGRFFPKTSSVDLLRKSSSTTKTQTSQAAFNKIAFLGGGKMGQAILKPLVSSGLQPASQVMVCDPNPDTLSQIMKDNAGVKTTQSIQELLSDADLIVCAVKPQNITPKLLKQIHDAPRKPSHGTFLSVIAGVPLDSYAPTGYSKIVRSMPNTPAMLGRGMTVWCATDSLTSSERNRINEVLKCLGETVRSFCQHGNLSTCTDLIPNNHSSLF